MSELKIYHCNEWHNEYTEFYIKSEADKVMDELKAENRMLKRALWVTRAAMAKFEKDRWDAFIDCGNKRNRKDPAWVKTGKLLETSEWRRLWADNERKCSAKAGEYK